MKALIFILTIIALISGALYARSKWPTGETHTSVEAPAMASVFAPVPLARP